MSDRTQIMLSLLNKIEDFMRASNLWETVSPPPAAFESQQPFCVDTMVFSQWLQWIFIARFRAILEGGHPLPEACGIAVMAEEALKGMEIDLGQMLIMLREFDSLFDQDRRL